MMRLTFHPMLLVLLALLACTGCETASGPSFRADLPHVTRPWIGPEYWSNPLQDWRIRGGRIECLTSAPNRNVALLTYDVADSGGDVHVRVRLGLIESNDENLRSGWAGLLIGTRGAFEDYRDTALRGEGIAAGLNTSGELFVGEPSYATAETIDADLLAALLGDGVTLDLTAVDRGAGAYDLRLRLENPRGEILDAMEVSLDGDRLTGGVALVADYDRPTPGPFDRRTYHPSFWFDEWQVQGSRVSAHPDRAFGPILFALHTLSEGTLNMTAQMPPMSDDDDRSVRLAVQRGGQWQEIETAAIDPAARTATFDVPRWPDSVDTAYRLVYDMIGPDGQFVEHRLEGTVRRDPIDEEEIVVAGFTGNNDLGFPHADLVERVQAHDPDLLLFTGDNIYESVGGFGYLTDPPDLALLDYLRKWYLFGWEYGALTKDIPTVTIPDDHDVYHGNVWGAGGKATEPGATKKQMQDSGGYLMPPEWVNAVERTQTAHLPAPYNATPVDQGIGVYYTDLIYGGVSVAVIEDRKWKSAPKTVLPAYLDIENGWAENRPTNPPEALYAPEAELLGARQLDFLEVWSADWTNGAWMKLVMSQTIFANVATLPDTALSDVVVPQLEIISPDEYAPNDRIVQDMDSNGWPKHGRDAALRAIRKGYAFHVAGDQHLGSTIQYGVDAWGDAGYAVCVPSVANYYPRRWYPPEPGANRSEEAPRYAGDFLDGFGNHMSVLAVSNPYTTGMEPSNLYDRAPGYGIVRLNRETRDIHIANWPRHVDPEAGAPYPGWPITINQMDNYGRAASAWLPTLHVDGMEDPVVQVIDESTDEIVYTIRIEGTTFDPKVFAEGSYTVRIGDPDGEMQTIGGVESSPTRGANAMAVTI